MKYLKKYNENSSNDEIKKNLHDICLELSDENFKITTAGGSSIDYRHSPTLRKDEVSKSLIAIDIFKNTGNEFSFLSIYETVFRILDYMKIEGFEQTPSCRIYTSQVRPGGGHSPLKSLTRIHFIKFKGEEIYYLRRHGDVWSNCIDIDKIIGITLLFEPKS